MNALYRSIFYSLLIGGTLCISKQAVSISEKDHNNTVYEIHVPNFLNTDVPITILYERVVKLTNFAQEQELFVDAFTNAYKDEHDTFEKLGIYNMRAYFIEEFKQEFCELTRSFNNPSPVYLIRARLDEKIVGFITFNQELIPGQVYIRWIAVSPAYGRLGIGQGLVSCIKKILPETKQLVLVAYKLDKPAMNFWSNKMRFAFSDYSRKEYDALTFQGFTLNV